MGDTKAEWTQDADQSALDRSRKLYLDLLERSLCNIIYQDPPRQFSGDTREFNYKLRNEGRDWPAVAYTMIGRLRLSHLRGLVEQALREGISGDFIETGVWRGGACILMRGVLAAYAVTDRVVHVADSFRGLPPPDGANYPADAGLDFTVHPELAIPRSAVEEAFRRFALLDGQVRFHEGWFKDTLPRLTNERFAIIRLDGDLYESTWDALTELYPRLSAGGFAVIDDYGCIRACRAAVDEYRNQFGITGSIVPIDWTGVFWRKPASD